MDAVFAEFLRLRYPKLTSEFQAFKADHTASPLVDSTELAAPASPVPACKASASSTAASVVPAVPASPILASKTAASSAVVTVPAARSSAASVAPSKTPTRRSPAPASSSSDSDSEMEVDLAPASSTDGFTLVQKEYRKHTRQGQIHLSPDLQISLTIRLTLKSHVSRWTGDFTL
ncbi:uncharacterized protein LOC134200335 [Bombyx mori]|uniref:uncharacterized protein LOC134200335 n=1 Tax=Bombyx mori TaxID=7091 RepID=UPI002ED3B73F